MTDPGTADRTYIGPMSADLVEEIIEKVQLHVLMPTQSPSLHQYHHHADVLCCRSAQMQCCQQWEARQPSTWLKRFLRSVEHCH